MAWEPDYIEVEDLADYLRITHGNDDDELAVAISAASRAIDAHCNRQFGKVTAPEARTYSTFVYFGERAADIDDLMSTAGLTGITDYELVDRNAAAKGKPWTRVILPWVTASTVTITASWGWTAIPAAVAMACRLQASRFHARRDSPFGVAGSPDVGSELRLLARVDPDVAVALRKVRRPRKVG